MSEELEASNEGMKRFPEVKVVLLNGVALKRGSGRMEETLQERCGGIFPKEGGI